MCGGGVVGVACGAWRSCCRMRRGRMCGVGVAASIKDVVAEVVKGLMGSSFAAARPLGCVNSCGGGMGSIGVAVVGFHMGGSKGRVGLGQHTTLEHQEAVRRSVETASSDALPPASGSRGC